MDAKQEKQDRHTREALTDVDAGRFIEQADVIRLLSFVDQECFADALLSPPESAPALERAFVRRTWRGI